MFPFDDLLFDKFSKYKKSAEILYFSLYENKFFIFLFIKSVDVQS